VKKISQLCLLFTLSLSTVAYSSPIKLGQQAFQQGHFEQAVQHWETALAKISKPPQYIDISVYLAVAYQSLGLSQEALKVLQSARTRAQQINDPVRYANVLSHLGDIYIAKGDLQKAQTYLEQAVDFANKIPHPLLLANILNKQGNLLMAEGKYTEAKDEYQKSFDKQADDKTLTAKVQLNLIRAMVKKGDYDQAESNIHTALKHIKKLPDSHDKAFALIDFAQLLQTLQTQAEEPEQVETQPKPCPGDRGIPSEQPISTPIEQAVSTPSEQAVSVPKKTKAQQANIRLQSYNALIQAQQIAQSLQDDRAISYTKGYLAQLYADEKRYKEAIQLTQQAIFYAQHKRASPQTVPSVYDESRCGLKKDKDPSLLVGHYPLLYRWEWQLGRLLKTQGQTTSALAAYRRAVCYLQIIRQEWQHGYRRVQSFREAGGPLYFELADLLLQLATQTSANKPNLLKEAKDNLELFKVVELQDYFQDDCVIELQTKVADIEQALEPGTAVFYPIILPDRIELLLNMRESIQQFTVPHISNALLKQEVEQFRKKMECSENINSLKQHAQQLYKWFIKPIAKTLTAHHIDTLIIVPDAILRTIPFAALHDGEQYLIQRYAIAVTLGSKLTDPTRPIQRDNIQVLLNGLSKKVPDEPKFPALLHVTQELKDTQAVLGGKILQDEDFIIPNVENQLKSTAYSIVHFATHGNFDSNPDKTFLLTYKGRLKMNHLGELISISEFRDQPLELLTLSACQTAKGDDKAALGLAGIAVKTGARSALATLWSVNDKATAQLVTAFYQNLKKNPALSKAQALQKAQQQLLQDPIKSHPYFWAPLLLIGNWL